MRSRLSGFGQTVPRIRGLRRRTRQLSSEVGAYGININDTSGSDLFSSSYTARAQRSGRMSRDLRRQILKQIMIITEEELDNLETPELGKMLYYYLGDKGYLIVLDDVWDTASWGDLSSALPDDCNGSRILITTRNESVVRYVGSGSYHLHHLTEEEIWKIVISGVFGAEDHEIPARQLIQLWIAEGFIHNGTSTLNLEDVGEQYLEELIDRNWSWWAKGGQMSANGVNHLDRREMRRLAIYGDNEEDILALMDPSHPIVAAAIVVRSFLYSDQVHRGGSSLPPPLWSSLMQQLRHLYFKHGSSLPDPRGTNHDRALCNLQTLSYIRPSGVARLIDFGYSGEWFDVVWKKGAKAGSSIPRTDTITAYALEDNELWLRHLLGLVFSFTTKHVEELLPAPVAHLSSQNDNQNQNP
ncbi:NB-ARC [Dillenia turbinata]|uniref:NB-ARC n=1 Tax=Dillenia turbinata TaxID=194707 RepID=A0AAN8W021_9MAGN